MPFNMTIPFTDTVVPKFIEGYPMLDEFQTDAPDQYPATYQYVSDYTIRPRLQTDKEATMYYMIMPRTNVENATITAQDVFYGTINGANVIKRTPFYTKPIYCYGQFRNRRIRTSYRLYYV